MTRYLIVAWSLLAGTAFAITPEQLAQHWAPRIYHDTNSSYGYEAEYITRVDYDGNWNSNDNWENLYQYAKPSYLYYKVSETATHYFIIYGAFHPRDDGPEYLWPVPTDKHENDFEGAVFMIRKDGSDYGQFIAMETMAHNQFYQYSNLALQEAHDDIDGSVPLYGHRPKIFIQANGPAPSNGHAWHACDSNCSSAPGGDGIVYYYGGVAEVPNGGSGNYSRQFSYDLISLDTLWEKRYDVNNLPFVFWGTLGGDSISAAGERLQANAANLPWTWDDSAQYVYSGDGPTWVGDFNADAPHMIDTHFGNVTSFGSFSRYYLRNDHYNCSVDVLEASSQSNRDPWGGKSDIYVEGYANGQPFWSESLFKKDGANVGTFYATWMGAYDATTRSYNGVTRRRYLNVPANQNVTFEFRVYDSDTGGDDYMGSISRQLKAGQYVSGYREATSNGDARLSYSVSCVR